MQEKDRSEEDNTNKTTKEPDAKDDTSKEEDNRPIGEKIEDTMDDVVMNVQDFFYGDKDDPDNIIATMPDPDNEIRHINKVQTRRNFNKKYAFKIYKWLFLSIPIILGIVAIVAIFSAIFK